MLSVIDILHTNQWLVWNNRIDHCEIAVLVWVRVQGGKSALSCYEELRKTTN